MDVSTILLIVVVILLLYLSYNYFFGPTQITSVLDAKNKVLIASSNLINSSHNNNFAYSLWFYISDWNYRYGEPKYILYREDDDGEPTPTITLGAMLNNIDISLSTYPSEETMSGNQIHTCSIENVPLQKWVNLLISVYGRSLDVYLDGKLVRTCILPGLPKIDTENPAYLTPNGGFAGYTANLQFFDSPINPQQAWNIYKEGYGGGSWLGNLFNRYRVRVSFLANNKESGSLEI